MEELDETLAQFEEWQRVEWKTKIRGIIHVRRISALTL